MDNALQAGLQAPAADPTKIRYRLASATRRSGARLCDLVVMALVATGIGTALFYQQLYVDQGQSFYDIIRNLFVRDDRSAAFLDAVYLDTWRMVLFGFLTIVAYLLYFTLTPLLTGGFTLFSWIFFIHVVELKNSRAFVGHLLLRDLFSWIAPIFLGLVVILASIRGSTVPLGSLFNIFSFRDDANADVAAIVFKALYAATTLVSLILVGAMWVRSGRMAWQDYATHTAVVLTRDVDTGEDPAPVVKTKEARPPGTADASKIRDYTE